MIRIVEEWARRHNMKINCKKSNLMSLNSRNITLREDIGKYKYTNKYKYLGMWVSPNMRIETHVLAIQPKINYIIHSLRPILLRGHFKLNNNLFKTFIMPLYRLCTILYSLVNPK